MRLLEILPNGDFRLTPKLYDNEIPQYAILSHRWEDTSQEVTFKDMLNGWGRHKAGYEKIRFCGERARVGKLRYFWVDSCCIDKSNSQEIQETITSMFRWYQRAAKCYVYLADVSTRRIESGDEEHRNTWEEAFRKSEWFTRGWTLQELLAPTSVQFFSKEGELLGDKQSLEQCVHEITELPILAIQGSELSQFSAEQKFAWAKNRKTTREEDGAYSLLGILEISMPVIYGEGRIKAMRRLEKEIDEFSKAKQCLRDLRITDPLADKFRIEETNGGLLADSYRWVLEDSDFQRWRNDRQSHLLWIKGDPGKGKTMLICGIIDELKKLTAETHLLSFFFCQATDLRINNATAILRGLLFLLINQQPSLISHVQQQHDLAGRSLFEDVNAWVTLSDIFTRILEDPSLKSTYLIIDALDECVAADLPKLLDFIVRKSSISSRVKWIVSSRVWPIIEKYLDTVIQKVRLCLELNEESVSAAVAIFIQLKVNSLAKRNKYSSDTRDAVQRYLSLNANGTFLWVALVCQELSNTPEWKVLWKLTAFPPGLDALYRRMIGQIKDSEDAELCTCILATVLTVYRPLTLDELASVVDMPDGVASKHETLSEMIRLCGSFLTLQKHIISFVHQSAKDFLVGKAYSEIFPSSIKHVHRKIFSQLLQVMSNTLKRDIYNLGDLGVSIDQIKQPDSDPLSPIRYPCVYWIDHLYDSYADSDEDKVYLQNGMGADTFIKEKYLYWLEALSLCRSVPQGVLGMAKLEALTQRFENPTLYEIVHDACRFIMDKKQTIEIHPLQAYASALIFSPINSVTRQNFNMEEPNWITVTPAIGKNWSPCLATLEGHSQAVNTVVFSHDSTRLASASSDGTVRIWDAGSGKCLAKLEGHKGAVWLIVFSYDSTRLVSVSEDYTIQTWDTSSDVCLRMLEGYNEGFNQLYFGASSSIAFSSDLTRFASGSGDGKVCIWDTSSGVCLQMLEKLSVGICPMAFSHESTRLASGSSDGTVKIWDTGSGKCLVTVKGHSLDVGSVTFSHNSTRLASVSRDCTICIWDACSGECLGTLKGHGSSLRSVAFSHDSTRLASGSSDGTVWIWDSGSGECLSKLEGHSGSVLAVNFSHDSTHLASASYDSTVRIWDTSSNEDLATLEGHCSVWSVTFSHDLTRLASASYASAVRIWDTGSGKCLATLKGNNHLATSVVFSHDSTRLASASYDCTVQIWDAGSGRPLAMLEGHKRAVWSVAFSHDSTRLASASEDCTVQIWDADSGECLAKLEGHERDVFSVVFSHDSTQLASGSSRGIVKIWDAGSSTCLRTLESYGGSVNSVAFSHDSTRLASGLGDGTVWIWDTSSGVCLQMLNFGRSLKNISFDTTSSNLHTDIGTVALDTMSTSSIPALSIEPQNPKYRSAGLSPDGEWITWKSKNMVRLPYEYRPSCSVVSGRTIGIGVGTGKVWMCTLNIAD